MNAFSTAARLPRPDVQPLRAVACLRINGFSSWVREQIDPAQPDVAIFSDSRILCCSPSLRRQGLVPGDSLLRGRHLFPHASFHQHDHHLDAATWEDVLHLLHTIAPNLTALRPGWALMIPHDLTGVERLARSLRASVGIARSRMVAMLAALDAPPGALRHVEPASGTSFLGEVPVGRLLDIGLSAELVGQLERFGAATLGHLLQISRTAMFSRFGREGLRLFDLLHLEASRGDVPLFEPPPSVVATAEIAPMSHEGNDLSAICRRLAAALAAELGERRAQLMTVSISGPSVIRPRSIRRVLAIPTSDPPLLAAVCRDLLRRVTTSDESLTSLRVELGGIIDGEGASSAEPPALHRAVQVIDRPVPGRSLKNLIG